MVPMAFFSMNFMFKKMGKSSIIECLQLWSFESMEYGFLSTYFVWTYVFSCIFHRVALTNLQPNYSGKKSRKCETSLQSTWRPKQPSLFSAGKLRWKILFEFCPAEIIWHYYESTKLGYIFQILHFKAKIRSS